MGFGAEVTEYTDLEIRSYLTRAAAAAHSYCSVPMTPAQHDFRGGTVTGEKHRWNFADPLSAPSDLRGRRVYPYHQPLKEITRFRVQFTNTYEVEIDPSNIYINDSENWAEIVAIAGVVSGVYPVGINFGLFTPVAIIDYTYGWEFEVVDEILAPTDATIVYQAANQFWLNDTVEVKVDGVVEIPASVDPVEGTVTLSTMQAADAVVTLSYTYTLPSAIPAATGHLATSFIHEAELDAKGLGNLASLRVEEVELRRTYRPTQGAEGGGRSHIQSMDPVAAAYLDSFIYFTVR